MHFPGSFRDEGIKTPYPTSFVSGILLFKKYSDLMIDITVVYRWLYCILLRPLMNGKVLFKGNVTVAAVFVVVIIFVISDVCWWLS
jgi:hypothetical protein